MKNHNHNEILEHISNKGILISSKEDFYEVLDFFETNDVYWKGSISGVVVKAHNPIVLILGKDGFLTWSKERHLMEQATPFETWIGQAQPSQAQLKRVQKIIDYFGEEKVAQYIEQFYPDVNLNSLTREQSQKIITGMIIPNAVYGVHGRDYSPMMSR